MGIDSVRPDPRGFRLDSRNRLPRCASVQRFVVGGLKRRRGANVEPRVHPAGDICIAAPPRRIRPQLTGRVGRDDPARTGDVIVALDGYDSDPIR